jgi:hypothetical protein
MELINTAVIGVSIVSVIIGIILYVAIPDKRN